MKTLRSSLLSFLVGVGFMSFAIAGENLGMLNGPQDLGRVAGNSNAEQDSYNYVLVFRLGVPGQQFRAMSDVEAHVSRIGDTLHRIGFLGGLVITAIKSSQDYGALYSRYARGSSLLTICGVYDFGAWGYSEKVTKISFGDRPLAQLCN